MNTGLPCSMKGIAQRRWSSQSQPWMKPMSHIAASSSSVLQRFSKPKRRMKPSTSLSGRKESLYTPT